MIEDKYKRNVFKKYKNKIMEINKHYDSCKYKDRHIPINECMCNCYEKQIFNMGREAQEKLFYNKKIEL